jgi:hypothetical protein
MSELVHTESGAIYEFRNNKARRVNPSHNKRGDGEWQTLITRFPKTPVVGSPMVLVLASLTRYGPDDIGTDPGEASPVTTRRTTPVISIEGD